MFTFPWKKRKATALVTVDESPIQKDWTTGIAVGDTVYHDTCSGTKKYTVIKIAEDMERKRHFYRNTVLATLRPDNGSTLTIPITWCRLKP